MFRLRAVVYRLPVSEIRKATHVVEHERVAVVPALDHLIQLLRDIRRLLVRDCTFIGLALA